MIRWCTAPEIFFVTVIIISHFGLFVALLPPQQPKKSKLKKKMKKKHLKISSFYICVPKIMIRWCTFPEIWCVTNVIIFHFGPFFALFYPHNSPKNQNFQKMKQATGDITILHRHTKNYDQMVYGSWDMVCDRCNCYFSFWAIFCPFTPLTAQKIKILKKW